LAVFASGAFWKNGRGPEGRVRSRVGTAEGHLELDRRTPTSAHTAENDNPCRAGQVLTETGRQVHPQLGKFDTQDVQNRRKV
jgi:hypothetical protein